MRMNITDSENNTITKQLILGNLHLPQEILNYIYSFAFQDKEIYARKKKYSKLLTDIFQNILRDCGGPNFYSGHWTIYYNRIRTYEEEMNHPYTVTFNRDTLLQLQGISCMKCGNYMFHNIYNILENHNNKYLYCVCPERQTVREFYGE